jgi:hypothetical protein
MCGRYTISLNAGIVVGLMLKFFSEARGGCGSAEVPGEFLIKGDLKP